MDAAALTTEALALEAERRGRRKLRRDFGAFCNKAMWAQRKTLQPHHRLMVEKLQWLADTPDGRLMLLMPPGAAKSTYASVLFPAWWLGHGRDDDPERGRRHVLAASHTDDLAGQFSLKVQGIGREFGKQLGWGLKTEARGLWQTTLGGEYKASGVGTGIGGFRAWLLDIDDPFKSRAEADSELRREEVWQWYHDDALNRLVPGGRVVLTMTRWHPDDLAGRILEKHPGEYQVIKLPAIAGADDPLGRLPGEPLWSGDPAWDYPSRIAAAHKGLEETGDLRGWWSLWMQEPRNPEGSLFKVGKMPLVASAPAGNAVRAWDLAASDGSTGDPDWTVGLKLATGADGRWTVADVKRVRGSPAVVEKLLLDTAREDGVGVPIGIAQDPGQAGKAQIAYLVRMLKGFRVVTGLESGDKVTRAGLAASQAEVGNIAIVVAPWTAAFIAELRDFPAGRKDDQVDALSRAFGMAALGPIKSRWARVNVVGR